ncbi:MAG: hypothetical protein GY898_09935 [Proteobacteria bacterium]|nr:hypothetical protein [Pseudomonadota bacterium]
MRAPALALACCLLASVALADEPAPAATIQSATADADQLLVDVTVSNPTDGAIVAVIDPPLLLPTGELACLAGLEWRGSLVRLAPGTSATVAVVVPGSPTSSTVGFSYLWAPEASLGGSVLSAALEPGQGLLLNGRSGTARDGNANPRAAKLFSSRASAPRVPVAAP